MRKLEDQQRKRQTKRQKHVVALADMDDWEVPVPERKKRKTQPKRRVKPASEPICDKPSFAETADAEPLADAASHQVETEAVDAPEPHHFDAESEESCGSSESEDLLNLLEWANRLEANTNEAQQETDTKQSSAKSNSESSSSSNSSSSSSSSSDQENQIKAMEAPESTGAAKAKPKSKAKAKVKQRQSAQTKPAPSPVAITRDFTNRIEYGMHHLTPRFKRDRTIQSYQMSCHLPQHNVGDQRCSRELTVTVTGSEESTRRILKAWVLLGHGLPTREQHMDAGSRQQLLTSLKDGTLLSESELDKISAASEKSAVVAPLQPKPSGDSPPPTNAKTLLGKRDGCVPEDAHNRMLDLAARGAIPITTLSQRQRNRLTSGTEYGVPPELKEALTYGYLHPNLAPPQGFRWGYQGGKWMLRIHGG